MEIKAQCDACGGTGIYQGMAEREGFGVQCYRCKGTGCRVIYYQEFTGLVPLEGVKRVLECNPGICVGVSKDQDTHLNSFGGISYDRWADGEPFPRGSEMRNYTCPAWWFQLADGKLKPRWDDCSTGGQVFSQCPSFASKGNCWARWDKENPE